MKIARLVVLLCSIGFLAIGTVRAHDARCDASPYGASEAEFRAYVKDLGYLVPVTELFPWLCNAKFGAADRTGLYNLGITDAQIESESVGELAIAALKAMKTLADHALDDQSAPTPQSGVFSAFTCIRSSGQCTRSDPNLFRSRAQCEQYIRMVHMDDLTQPVYMHCFFRADPWSP